MARFLPGKFIWFEHSSGDALAARAFYEALFGWKVAPMPIGERSYDLIQNAGEGIAGFVRAPQAASARWISYLSVADVDKSFAAALAAGARPLRPPADLVPVGRGAEIIDPAGAAVALWKNARDDREDRDMVTAGDWFWNQLLAPDLDAALSFYEKVFGYTRMEVGAGASARYCVLQDANGIGRAGLMKAPREGMPVAWTPCVKVEQADSTAARVAPLGGKLVMPPQDVPTLGRLGTLADPLGALVAFIQPVVKA